MLLWLAAPALGNTLYVGPTRTYPTITTAITAAAPGDTVLVDPGTYNESVRIQKSLTLAGNNGTFNMTGTGPLIEIDSSPTVTIADAHLDPTLNGAIDTSGGTLTLTRVTVVDAKLTIGHGGAIHASNATIAIDASTFDGNAAFNGAQGGHIYAADTALTITDSTFANGVAEKGGGIWMIRGSLSATNVAFVANQAITVTETARGGAIRAQDATITLTGCTFTSDTAQGYGGAVSTFGGTLTVDGGTFTSCVATGEYGGALAVYQSVVDIADATFLTNRAEVDSTGAKGHGGAIMAYGQTPGSLTVSGCTFDQNVAGGYGGAIRVEAGASDISDSVFTDNTGNYAAAIHGMAKAPMTIADSEFTGNTAVAGGGAVRWRPDDTVTPLTVTGSTFDDNTVTTGPGGALYTSSGGALHVYDNVFRRNSGYPGGAVSVYDMADTVVLRSRFCGNLADGSQGYGGGLYGWQTGPVRIANSVFVDNGGGAWGGGAYLQESGIALIENSAFLSNDAGTGGGAAMFNQNGTFRNNVVVANNGDGVSGGTGASFTFAYNLFDDNVDTATGGTFATSLGSNNLQDTAPGFQAWSNDGNCDNDVLFPGKDSALLDAGDPSLLDPDGSRSDLGPGGGPDADAALWTDTDNDGSADLFDCAPTDPARGDNLVEVPYDGVDQDCTGTDLVDVDGDGYSGPSDTGVDCDDDDDAINPGATDVPYDGIDQNCNGGDLMDADGDGYIGVDGGGDDCDDDHDTIHPGATDVPGNFVDEDCSGADTPGDPVIDSDTGDDVDTGRKTCNCDTSPPAAGLLWLALSVLAIRRRARR